MKSATYCDEVLAELLTGIKPSWHDAEFLYISLHTSAPRNGQNHHEATYPGYERVKIQRSKKQWNVEGQQATNRQKIEFAVCTGDVSQDLAHFAIGTKATGQGSLFHIGDLDDPITVTRMVRPFLPVNYIIISES